MLLVEKATMKVNSVFNQMARDNFGNHFPNRRDIFVEKTFFLERHAMLKLACGLPQLRSQLFLSVCVCVCIHHMNT